MTNSGRPKVNLTLSDIIVDLEKKFMVEVRPESAIRGNIPKQPEPLNAERRKAPGPTAGDTAAKMHDARTILELHASLELECGLGILLGSAQ